MRRLNRALLLAVLLKGLAAALGARAAEAPARGCNSPAPVLNQKPLVKLTGSWRLPIFSDKPDVLTHAQLTATLEPPSGSRKLWAMRVDVAFPDPQPFGLPYSFEMVELQWASSAGTGSALLDWTQGCTQVGRSIFPGQQWSESWEIPGTEELSELGQPDVSLWGGRI